MNKPSLKHEQEGKKYNSSLCGFTVQHVIVCKFKTTQISTHQTCPSDSSSAISDVIPTVSSDNFNPKQSTTLSRTDMLRLCNSVTRQTQSRSQKRKTTIELIALFQFPTSIKTSDPIFLKCTQLPLRDDTILFLHASFTKSLRRGISVASEPIACRHARQRSAIALREQHDPP